jgi:GNAT superfamily N-acetyltransferase
MSTDISIRLADRCDRSELRAMQALSFLTLGAPYYDNDVIEAFIAGVGTMEDALIDDGTYFLATSQGRIVGCGGWSRRTPGYMACVTSSGTTRTAPRATVRSIYVHPDFARRGIARALMATIEAKIIAAGSDTASLAATLSGIPLYRRLGYRSGLPVALALQGGRTLVCLDMHKAFVRVTADTSKAA